MPPHRERVDLVDPQTAARRLGAARTLARALDSAVRVPGTNVRFGLDAVLGLVPGLGDVAGALLAGYMVVLGSRLGAPASLAIRMLANVAVDTIVGVVPILGDLFDVGWKSNTRNLALLERYLERPVQSRKTNRIVAAAIVAALALLVVGGLFATWVVVRALWRMLSS